MSSQDHTTEELQQGLRDASTPQIMSERVKTMSYRMVCPHCASSLVRADEDWYADTMCPSCGTPVIVTVDIAAHGVCVNVRTTGYDVELHY